MKKQWIMLVCLAIMASSCGNDNTETRETATTSHTEITSEADTTTTAVPADSTAIENATIEIEEASATVDSLLSEI